MITYKEYNNKCLEDSNFKKEYDDLEPEYDIINAMIKVRKERGLTQKQLSELTGISQADISRIENGTRNPSLEMIKRLATGMGMRLKLEFIPVSKVED
ncbi:MAG: helix-turn-helix transcriptional regulator [Erysipelotrichaceae bacterium]|nr:helix-turn-helix transcriptional regulator [Solobacterium sp.]MDY2952636.1 helix-turn-helix transcriptional regulator [Erysipelotrichaceae bacterium]MCI6846041.1 helix-turn-helix transcriptional regulator [Solobacterium sp.]MDD7775539.1 helix-turn-helix transcriptional regulator [Solobacterium sp.]MDY4791425.1 helix-turn-helix transcriptional regulator [Erysipelotrichaceae bacterium]